MATGLVVRYAALVWRPHATCSSARAPDTFLWNVMLQGQARAGPSHAREAVALFARMRASTRAPAAGNRYTYTFVVKACAGAGDDDDAGRAVHALAVGAGVDLDVLWATNRLWFSSTSCTREF